MCSAWWCDSVGTKIYFEVMSLLRAYDAVLL